MHLYQEITRGSSNANPHKNHTGILSLPNQSSSRPDASALDSASSSLQPAITYSSYKAQLKSLTQEGFPAPSGWDPHLTICCIVLYALIFSTYHNLFVHLFIVNCNYLFTFSFLPLFAVSSRKSEARSDLLTNIYSMDGYLLRE